MNDRRSKIIRRLARTRAEMVRDMAKPRYVTVGRTDRRGSF
jgi:hypothetical protein